MTEPFSRRDWNKTVSVAGVGALVPRDPVAVDAPPARVVIAEPEHGEATADILALSSTSEVYIPPRGESLMAERHAHRGTTVGARSHHYVRERHGAARRHL